MQDLFEKLIEIPEGEGLSVLEIEIAENGIAFEIYDSSFVPILNSVLKCIGSSELDKGLIFELYLTMDEKGINTTAIISNSLKINDEDYKNLTDEIEVARQKMNKDLSEYLASSAD